MRDVVEVYCVGFPRPLRLDGVVARRLVARGLARPVGGETATATAPENAMKKKPMGRRRA